MYTHTHPPRMRFPSVELETNVATFGRWRLGRDTTDTIWGLGRKPLFTAPSRRWVSEMSSQLLLPWEWLTLLPMSLSLASESCPLLSSNTDSLTLLKKCVLSFGEMGVAGDKDAEEIEEVDVEVMWAGLGITDIVFCVPMIASYFFSTADCPYWSVATNSTYAHNEIHINGCVQCYVCTISKIITVGLGVFDRACFLWSLSEREGAG